MVDKEVWWQQQSVPQFRCMLWNCGKAVWMPVCFTRASQCTQVWASRNNYLSLLWVLTTAHPAGSRKGCWEWLPKATKPKHTSYTSQRHTVAQLNYLKRSGKASTNITYHRKYIALVLFYYMLIVTLCYHCSSTMQHVALNLIDKAHCKGENECTKHQPNIHYGTVYPK